MEMKNKNRVDDKEEEEEEAHRSTIGVCVCVCLCIVIECPRQTSGLTHTQYTYSYMENLKEKMFAMFAPQHSFRIHFGFGAFFSIHFIENRT